MTELATIQHRTEVAIAEGASALIEWAQSADAAYQLADKICGTAFVPSQFKGKPVEAAAAMLAGAEVGLSPMASLRAFDVIQGVAAPRALTMRAVAQSHGHEFITDVATPAKVIMRGKRRGASEWQSVEWSIQRAQQLGLTHKDQWKKQPQTMLIARATTELVRLIAADAILGIGYSYEELQDSEESTVIVGRSEAAPAKARRKPAAPDPEPAEPEFEPAPEVAAAESTADLRTDAQMKKLWALVKERGMGEEAFRAYLDETLGREVESTKTLTKGEASRLIDLLETGEVHDAELLPEADQ